MRALGWRAVLEGRTRIQAVEVLPDGRWMVADQALSPAAALDALKTVDVFFLALHGGEGEDGTLQGLFDANGRAYTGSGVRASALSMDKVTARLVASAAGLRVAPGVCVDPIAWEEDPAGIQGSILALAPNNTGPEEAAWFVKPRCGGSSVATTWLRSTAALRSGLAQALKAVFDEGDDALVELGIAGIEVSVGVLTEPPQAATADLRRNRERVLTPIEIRPNPDHFFDYDEKYQASGATELCPPESLSPELIHQLRRETLVIHRALSCTGHTRTDFIVPLDSASGEATGGPVFLETNTLPGLMARSLLPQEAAVDGIDYPTLCQWMVLDALAQGARQSPGSGRLPGPLDDR